MKKIMFLVLFMALNLPLWAATWYVATNGNDNNPGTLAQPFGTLPAAIEAAEPGDQILLRGGHYASQEIRISKSDLHIASYPGEWAVITAVDNVEDISACLWYNEPETTGGTLERLEIVGGYYYAVKFETNWDWDNSVPFSQRRGVSGVTIRQCNIHHSGRDAIKLTPACANISIENCEIHHTGVGPGAQQDYNAEGVDNVNAPNLTIRGCYIHDIATTGVYVKGGGRNCLIEQNRIENCGEGGIYLGFYTDAEWFDTDLNPQYFENINGRVQNNIIVNTQHAGIGLWGAKDAQVYNNTVINGGQAEHAGLFFNTTDVWIDDNHSARVGSQNVRVENNIFVQAADQNLVMVRIRENSLIGANNVVDHNLYFDPNGVQFLNDNLDWQEWTLAQWKSQTALDAHSLEANPQLDADEHLLPNSPCINAGANVTAVSSDFDGHLRSDGTNDIGADEYGTVSGVTVPAPNANFAVHLQGNVVTDQLVFDVSATESRQVLASIVDAQGKVQVQQMVFTSAGTSRHSILASALSPGVYWLRVGAAMYVWVKV